MRTLTIFTALALAGIGGAAQAKDTDPCPAGLVCASDPTTVVKAVNDAGYKAVLGTDGVGDPKIDSSAQGYDFAIYFYGCEEHKSCSSLQFSLTFKPDPAHTLDFTNKWNQSERFIRVATTDKGGLTMRYDVTTIGGINAKNFADIVDWWQTMLVEMNKFYSENAPKPAAK